MKKLLVIVCFGLAMSLNAQVSSYLNKGESGAGVMAGYEMGNGYDGVYGIFSYSFNGNLDLSVCLSESYYNKDEVDLLNLDAKDFYYSGQLTWWVIREKPTSAIDVNFAFNVALEGANYKDYTYLAGSYNSFMGGWVGFNANVNFNLPNKWALQPMLITYYGFGYDNFTESGSTFDKFYHGALSLLGVSLSKRLDSGNSLVVSFLQGTSNYNNNNFYDVSVGYVIAL